MKWTLHRFLSLALIVLFFLSGCDASVPVQNVSAQVQVTSSTPVNTPVPAKTISVEFTPTITTQEPTLEPTLSANEAISCESNWCIFPGHFWLGRPIHDDEVEVTYRYGSTQSGLRETHHGIELIDPSGTPVLASADGVVVVSGTDHETIYGLYPNFYGNLIVIEHHLPQVDQTIYTLYAHLSKMDVQVGQKVTKGEKIGEVGYTGAAVGSHLHFEIRLGENSYNTTVNPELWLEMNAAPDGQKNGGLAVLTHFKDSSLYSYPILIEYFADNANQAPQLKIEGETYAWNTPVVSSWKENLAIGDLQPGIYRVSFIWRDRWMRRFIRIESNHLTVIDFDTNK